MLISFRHCRIYVRKKAGESSPLVFFFNIPVSTDEKIAVVCVKSERVEIRRQYRLRDEPNELNPHKRSLYCFYRSMKTERGGRIGPKRLRLKFPANEIYYKNLYLGTWRNDVHTAHNNRPNSC